jgi:hypothetical protein
MRLSDSVTDTFFLFFRLVYSKLGSLACYVRDNAFFVASFLTFLPCAC